MSPISTIGVARNVAVGRLAAASALLGSQLNCIASAIQPVLLDPDVVDLPILSLDDYGVVVQVSILAGWHVDVVPTNEHVASADALDAIGVNIRIDARIPHMMDVAGFDGHVAADLDRVFPHVVNVEAASGESAAYDGCALGPRDLAIFDERAAA